MGYETGDLRDLFREAEAELIRREDARDFNAEMAGLDIGRAARFHGSEFVEDRRQGRSGASASRREQRENLSLLQMLLGSNPTYAKLYNDTFDALKGAEAAADDALAKLEAAHTKARLDLQDMLDHAARLPDGTRVFKDKHAQVWSEHGARVSDADAATIHWRGDEPMQEVYADQHDYTDRLSHGIDEMRGVQVDLGTIHEEMADKDNPPAQERVGELRERIDQYQQRTDEVLAETSRKEAMPLAKAPEVQPERSAQLDIPTL